MTFHDKDVGMELEGRFVESRLHMDGEDRVDAAAFAVHRELQQALIGSRAVPHYAILDPHTGDFVFKLRLRGPDPAGWRKDFLRVFAALPERPVAK